MPVEIFVKWLIVKGNRNELHAAAEIWCLRLLTPFSKVSRFLYNKIINPGNHKINPVSPGIPAILARF